MWNKVKIFILNSIGFLIANPMFAYVLFGIILFFIFFGYLSSCREKREERKDEKNKIEILEDKGRIQEIEDQKHEQIANNIIKRDESEKANANFNAVINTDSNKRNANFSAVKRKFCLDHQQDSRCK